MTAHNGTNDGSINVGISAEIAREPVWSDTGEPVEDPTTPLVSREHWVARSELWQSTDLLPSTGRHPLSRPLTKPLARPQRFRPVARWKSIAMLVTVLVASLATCVGAVEVGRLSGSVLNQRHTATPAVATHTPTAGHATATPRK